MKTLRISLAVAALLAAAPLASQAQHSHAEAAPHAHQAAGETHAHMAPHGGVVRTAGKYHLELVAATNQLKVYLLGDKMSAVASADGSGTVLVQRTDNTTAALKLKPAGDHFTAELPAGAAMRTAIVTLKTQGKTINARFEKLDAEAPGKAVGAAYVCPMHSDVTSDKPGSCGKCGMALVKK